MRNHILLQLQPAFQRGQLCCQPFGGIFKALDTGSGQLEIGLRFLYLLVDRLDVAGEIFGIQGKRHNKVAEGFSHEDSLPFAYAKNAILFGVEFDGKFGYNKDEGS